MKQSSNVKAQMSKQSIIEKAIHYLFYLLIFFTPLLMNSVTSELFEFNKMLFVYFITIIIGALWLTDIILHKKSIKHFLPLDIATLLFLASQLLSTLTSIDRHTSFYGYYGRFNGGLLSIITYVILFYAFINYTSFKELRRFIIISLISSIVVIFWGLPGRFGKDLSCYVFTGELSNSCWTDQFRPAERLFSTLGQPNWLGSYLAIHFFLSLSLLLDKIRKNRTVFSVGSLAIFGYLLLNFMIILFTRSRSSLLATIGALVVIAVMYGIAGIKRKQYINKSMGVFVSILAAGMVILMLAFGTGVEKVDSLFKSLGKTQKIEVTEKPKQNDTVPLQNKMLVTDSYDIRKIVWQGAVELAKKYPLTGTGVETFAYSYYFVRPTEHNLTSEWDYLYNKAHNEFLNYYATTGIPGLVTYLLLLVTSLFVGVRAFIKSKENEEEHIDASILGLCISGALLTIHITNFFGFSTVTINLLMFLLPALALSSTSEIMNSYQLPFKLGNNGRKITIGLFYIFAVYLLFSVIQYYRADLLYSSSDKYVRSGDYQKAAVELQEALDARYEHVYQDKLSYVLANLAYIAAYQKEQKLAENLIKLAQQHNLLTLQAASSNILYWKTTAKNDYLFYQMTVKKAYIEDGLDSLEKAESLAPTDPKLPYTTALFYSLMSDEEKDPAKAKNYQEQALKKIEWSIKLKPDFKDSYFLKAQLLKKFGQKEESKKTFEYILKEFDPTDAEVKKELESF